MCGLFSLHVFLTLSTNLLVYMTKPHSIIYYSFKVNFEVNIFKFVLTFLDS